VWPFARKSVAIPERSIDEIRSRCRTLFIDDDEFDIVAILAKQRWKVDRVPDVTTFEDAPLVSSHVVFVDIHGVGRALGFADEGLGLAKAIKERFPQKKVVIYSAEKQGDRFHPVLSMADARLPKDAEPYQFLTTLEGLARECFTVELCARRIRQAIESELGGGAARVDESKILALLGSPRIEASSIAQRLGVTIQAAANIAHIISAFNAKP